MFSTNFLKCYYTNAQSVVNKIDELRLVAVDINPDVIVITESWAHGDIPDAFF